MSCVKCYKKQWCICQQLFYVYKENVVNNNHNCMCCFERMRVIEESKRKIKPIVRMQVNEQFTKIHKFYIFHSNKTKKSKNNKKTKKSTKIN